MSNKRINCSLDLKWTSWHCQTHGKRLHTWYVSLLLQAEIQPEVYFCTNYRSGAETGCTDPQI